MKNRIFRRFSVRFFTFCSAFFKLFCLMLSSNVMVFCWLKTRHFYSIDQKKCSVFVLFNFSFYTISVIIGIGRLSVSVFISYRPIPIIGFDHYRSITRYWWSHFQRYCFFYKTIMYVRTIVFWAGFKLLWIHQKKKLPKLWSKLFR